MRLPYFIRRMLGRVSPCERQVRQWNGLTDNGRMLIRLLDAGAPPAIFRESDFPIIVDVPGAQPQCAACGVLINGKPVTIEKTFRPTVTVHGHRERRE